MGGCSCMQKKNKYNSPTCSSHLVYIGLYRVVCCISQKLLLFLSVVSLFDFLQFSVRCGELGGGKGVCFSVFVNVNAQDVCGGRSDNNSFFSGGLKNTDNSTQQEHSRGKYSYCTLYHILCWCVEEEMVCGGQFF